MPDSPQPMAPRLAAMLTRLGLEPGGRAAPSSSSGSAAAHPRGDSEPGMVRANAAHAALPGTPRSAAAAPSAMASSADSRQPAAARQMGELGPEPGQETALRPISAADFEVARQRVRPSIMRDFTGELTPGMWACSGF